MNCCHDWFCTPVNYGRKVEQPHINTKNSTDSEISTGFMCASKTKSCRSAFIQVRLLPSSDPSKDGPPAHRHLVAGVVSSGESGSFFGAILQVLSSGALTVEEDVESQRQLWMNNGGYFN